MTEYGDVASVASAVQTPERCTEYSNAAEATPEPESAELEDTVTAEPVTFALAAGAVIEPVGAVLSIRKFVIVAEVNVLPTLSVVTTRRS